MVLAKKVKTSKNSFLHKSNKEVGKKNSQNHLFRTLEINPRLEATWGAHIEEKWLDLGKTSELSGVLTCPTPAPCSPATQQPWKISLYAQSSHQREQNKAGALLKPPSQGTVINWPIKLDPCKIPHKGKHGACPEQKALWGGEGQRRLSKTIMDKCLPLQCLLHI